MVRLKEGTPAYQSSTPDDFNTSMVRLKAFLFCIMGFSVLNFNTSMVRLKVTDLYSKDSPLKKFQYLNGAIKSLP